MADHKKRKLDSLESPVQCCDKSTNDVPSQSSSNLTAMPSQKYPKLDKFHSAKSDQPDGKVVNHEEWLKARKALLEEEKNLLRHMDNVTKLRQELPWEVVREDYVFDSVDGPKKLSELFKPEENIRDLIVYHLMWTPTDENPCATCSNYIEGFSAYRPQILAHRKANIVAIGRAPIEKIGVVAKRKGWELPVLSSFKNTFHYDYGVTIPPEEIKTKTAKFYNYGNGKYWENVFDMPGLSVFRLGQDGQLYHSYSVYERGLDLLNSGNIVLDTLAHGRDGYGWGSKMLTHLK